MSSKEETPVYGKKSIVFIRLEEFWQTLQDKTQIHISDFNELDSLFGEVITRCQQFVDEARSGRDEWRRKFKNMEEKYNLLKAKWD